jgi:hypothetical protein
MEITSISQYGLNWEVQPLTLHHQDGDVPGYGLRLLVGKASPAGTGELVEEWTEWMFLDEPCMESLSAALRGVMHADGGHLHPSTRPTGPVQ